jgi:UDP-glucose:(heptosyl)LPS alpha-1,3-glucosyltransferase
MTGNVRAGNGGPANGAPAKVGRLRIGLVIQRFDPRLGGAEQWTWQFAGQLLKLGHEVHSVAERFGDEVSKLGIVCHLVPRATSRSGFAEAAAGLLRDLRLDVVHDMGAGHACHVFQPHGGSRTASFEQNLLLLPSWLRPLKRRLARLLSRYREFDRLAAKQYARDGRLVIALSRMVAADMQRFHGVPPDQMRIVYNGVDLQRFSPAYRDQYRNAVRARLGVADKLLLLIVAHNFELKGVPTLLRATARLAAEGRAVHLAVAGGKRTARYERMARSLGAASAVTFLGGVSDPAPYYAAADVYVQPTFYDPCSLVVLEALASGLPVVTSRFNGAGELLTEGVQGSLLDDPADDAELVAKLLPYFDSAERDRQGTAARRLAENHSLERNCRELIRVYSEIAARKKQAA